MKKLAFINYTALCALALSMSTVSSCTDKENVIDSSELAEKLQQFKFGTSQEEEFTINLGINAKNKVVSLYSESITAETVSKNNSLLGSFFLDGKGCYNETLLIPNHVNKVWLYFPNSPEFGILSADVDNGRVILNQEVGGLSTRTITRGSDDMTITTDELGNITCTSSDGTYILYDLKDEIYVDSINTAAHYETPSMIKKVDMGNIFCISEWMPTQGKVNGKYETTYHYGGVVDVNGLKGDNNTVLANKSDAISGKFKIYKERGEFTNVTDDVVNIDIEGGTSSYEDENGIIQTKTHESCELTLTFIAEIAAYCNTFGYYYYETGKGPQSVEDGMKVDKFIIFPNTSLPGLDPFTAESQEGVTTRAAYKNYAPLKRGDKIKLLFRDSNGKITTKFPAGYTIGFFLAPNAYDIGWKWSGTKFVRAKGVDYDRYSQINFTQNESLFSPDRHKLGNSWMICSNVRMNHSSLGDNLRYVSFNEKIDDTEYIIFGVEDATDFSYTDMVFTIESSDPWMTHRNRLTSWSDGNPIPVGIYAFEDNWPNQGDYDMNDVLIRHTRTYTFDSKNYIKEITDYFEIINDIDAAALSNAFCIQIPSTQHGTITINGDIQKEGETDSYIIFKNIRESIESGKTKVSMTRTFSTPNKKINDFTYNPYIIINAINKMDSGRYEVHMPDQKITDLGYKLTSSTKGDSNWFTSRFISEDGSYPFAITIPMHDWNASAPGVPIRNTYTNYLPWVNSYGTKYRDWYK